jgi:two-component system, LuxR family, sensor kinase FixL
MILAKQISGRTAMRQDVTRILEEGTSAESTDWDEALNLFEEMCTKARLVELGTRASAIGHELRQPLFTISMATENLRLMLAKDDIPKAAMELAVDRIAEQVHRAQNMIARVLDDAAGARIETPLANPIEAMNNAVRFLEGLFLQADVAVRRYPVMPDALVALDRIQIEQIFVNVLRNAVDSIQARRREGWDGRGYVGIGFVMDGETLRCVVCDNGAGLAKGMSQTVFRPFLTTRPNEGTGLGLYICDKILLSIGGSIALRPRKSEGARVVISLPKAA